MDVELKPCPFCGGEAMYQIVQPKMDNSHYPPDRCKCKNHMCIGSKLHYPVKEWNTRAKSVQVEVDKIYSRILTAQAKAINAENSFDVLFNEIDDLAKWIKNES